MPPCPGPGRPPYSGRRAGGRGRGTIGAEGLNCRVRNGNGCDPLAMTTEKLGLVKDGALERHCSNPLARSRTNRTSSERSRRAELVERVVMIESKAIESAREDLVSKKRSQRSTNLKQIMVKPNGRLVRVSSTHHCAYTSRLSNWSSSRDLQGNLISDGASRLDAFSGYPFRT